MRSMTIDKRDISFRYTRGTGPGGQHKNRTSSCVVAKHVPTGIEVKVDGRDQHKNKRDAIRELEQRVKEHFAKKKAAEKKAKRDHAIHNEKTIRTYDFSRGVVKDHRSGKTASIKDVLGKGRIDKLR